MLPPNPDQRQIIGIGASPWLRLTRTYQEHLARVRKYRRGRAAPRCYLSHLPEQTVLAEKLGHDLQHAGVVVIKRAAEVVDSNDFVIMLDTDAYEQAFKDHHPALADDVPLVYARFEKERVISFRLVGETRPHRLQKCDPGRLCDDTHYLVVLFGLVLNLHGLPLTHAQFAPLRQALHEQWEQTLAHLASQQAKKQGALPLKIFISYAHEDEPFKKDLLKMLKPLGRKGVLEIWHDRQIEEGDEWRRAIETAMDESDLALLFVSKDFLDSPFIQDNELPRLLERRKAEGLRVVPIIIGPCMWQSVPVLSGLQALPANGDPVSGFPEGYARDRVWTEIALAIERRTREE